WPEILAMGALTQRGNYDNVVLVHIIIWRLHEILVQKIQINYFRLAAGLPDELHVSPICKFGKPADMATGLHQVYAVVRKNHYAFTVHFAKKSDAVVEQPDLYYGRFEILLGQALQQILGLENRQAFYFYFAIDGVIDLAVI